MPFITQGKTNWKFLLIVVVLAAIIGGGVLWCSLKEEQPDSSLSQNPSPECSKDEDCEEGEVCLKGACIVDETTDWQTYRNEEYGFEIEYPGNLTAKDWAFESRSWSLLVYIGENKSIGDGAISIGIKAGVNTLEQKSFFPFKVQIEDLDDVLISEDDYSAKKFSYKGPAHELDEELDFVEYFIEHSGYLYQIYWNKGLLPENTFNQILFTLRFIEDEKIDWTKINFPNEVITNLSFQKYVSELLDNNPELKIDKFNFREEKEISGRSVEYPQQLLPNQSSSKWIFSPNRSRAVTILRYFGEPDSSLEIFNRDQDQEIEELRMCGTPCGYLNIFWLDNDQFVFFEIVSLEYSEFGLEKPLSIDDPYVCEHNIHFYNFEKNIVTTYSQITSKCSSPYSWWLDKVRRMCEAGEWIEKECDELFK